MVIGVVALIAIGPKELPGVLRMVGQWMGKARRLDEQNARGGPVELQQQLASFFIGINDPFGQNPRGIPFTSKIFDIYDAWKSIAVHNERDEARRSIARS